MVAMPISLATSKPGFRRGKKPCLIAARLARQAASREPAHGGCAAGWLHTSEPADAILAECSLTECAASLEYVLLRCVLLSQWREKKRSHGTSTTVGSTVPVAGAGGGGGGAAPDARAAALDFCVKL